MLLVKGTRLQKLPAIFQDYEKLLITTWGHDPGVIAASNILVTLNDALTHSAVLVQVRLLRSRNLYQLIAHFIHFTVQNFFCYNNLIHAEISRLKILGKKIIRY